MITHTDFKIGLILHFLPFCFLVAIEKIQINELLACEVSQRSEKWWFGLPSLICIR